MSQQYIESLTRINTGQRLYNSINVIDVCPQRHFESKAVGEINTFTNCTKYTRILGGHDTVRSQSQVPELYKEGLQGLYLKYFSESHAGKGIVGVHKFILLYKLDQVSVEYRFRIPSMLILNMFDVATVLN